MKKYCLIAVILACSLGFSYAKANDSEAEIAIGGLKLIKSDAIMMDSEDLFISANLVKVSYKFTNSSDKDIKTLVSFPLPAVPYEIGEYYEDLSLPDYGGLNFKTLIDGKPAQYKIITIAELNGHDISDIVQKYNAPIDWASDKAKYDEWFAKLDYKQTKELEDKGLLKRDENGELNAAWSARTNILREQVFPARKTISVVHSYKPLIGGSVGGALSMFEQDTEISKHYSTQYCTDNKFMNGFHKSEAAAIAKGQSYSETWIGYVLKSGANWRGPIKNFHLTIDKGSPQNLVSFCMDGVKKTSPTTFEVFKTNFEPTKDLNILIVNF